MIVITTTCILTFSLVHGGVVPAPEILQGPSSKTTLTGPDGSVITAFLPGGKVATDPFSSLVAQSPPIVHIQPPMDVLKTLEPNKESMDAIRDTLIHSVESMIKAGDISKDTGDIAKSAAKPEVPVKRETEVEEAAQAIEIYNLQIDKDGKESKSVSADGGEEAVGNYYDEGDELSWEGIKK